MSCSGDTILPKGNDGENDLYVWYVSLKMSLCHSYGDKVEIVFMPLVTDKLYHIIILYWVYNTMSGIRTHVSGDR